VYSLTITVLHFSVICTGEKKADMNEFAGIEIEMQLLNIMFMSLRLKVLSLRTCEINLKPQRRLFDFEPVSISSPVTNVASYFVKGTSIRIRLEDFTKPLPKATSLMKEKRFTSRFSGQGPVITCACFSLNSWNK